MTGGPGEPADASEAAPDAAGLAPERAADGGQRIGRREGSEQIEAARRRRRAEEQHESGPPWTWGNSPWRGPRGGRGRGRGGGPWSAGNERPGWWPDDEPWPSASHKPWRGFGCLFGVLFLAGVLGLVSIALGVVGHVVQASGPAGWLVRLAATGVAILVVVTLVRTARTIRGSGTVLDALVSQAARVEAGDYAARVETVGPVPAPVRELARGFNTMAARLEADESTRRTLLADVTHELRTPLAVVRGSVEAILDGVHPADTAHLGAILEETEVLDRLIEDLRTLALSEAGALSLHREPTDLAVLAGDVATSFDAAAARVGLEITTRIADDLPLLDVDPVRIREVLANLVANAVRHTPRGGRVSIAADRTHEGAGDAVDIRVRDTGPGIDPAILPHVFERFARGPRSTGSGLGLSIARGLVELHGGTIAAELPPGGGTEIRIHLPLGARHP